LNGYEEGDAGELDESWSEGTAEGDGEGERILRKRRASGRCCDKETKKKWALKVDLYKESLVPVQFVLVCRA
jgi:hypothetical protein